MVDYNAEIVKLLKVLRKLDYPPAGPNWVRFIFDNVERTAKAMVSFAKGQPPFGYQPAYCAIKDRIELGIDLDAAIKVATGKGAPAGWVQNRHLVEAFFEYDEIRKYSASNPIAFDKELFRVSREVAVPIAPVSIIRERGKFVPVFVCGWTTNPLLLLQRRLLVTIYEDSFFSLTDYQDSPGELLFFPKNDLLTSEIKNANLRESEIWRRGDYDLLSRADLDQCVEIFALAREMARQVLQDEIRQIQDKMKAEGIDPTQNLGKPDDLFTKK
jgi:hypothetical protein